MHQFSPANGTVKQRSSSSRVQHYDNANIVPQSAQMPSHQQRRTRLPTSLILITSKKPDERPFSNTQSIPQASIAESTQELYKKDISTACKSFETLNKQTLPPRQPPPPASTHLYPSHAGISSSENCRHRLVAVPQLYAHLQSIIHIPPIVLPLPLPH